MRHAAGLAAVAALAALVGVSAAPAAHDLSPCRGSQLSGRFAVVRGSAGAGNIVYALVLRNRAASMCTLTGLPDVRLLDRRGRKLPTHVTAAMPGALTAVLVQLTPGRSARATARFSPDVPGPGEGAAGRPCEPVAYRLRVRAPGGGTTSAPVRPPTSVCSHGYLSFTAYAPVGG